LRANGVDAIAFDPAERPIGDLAGLGLDACFICLHGRFGEDGTVQGALELMRIPYTGSSVLASALAMDKVLTKQVWMGLGIPTPQFIELVGRESLTSEANRSRLEGLGTPLAVKPAREGSSLGFTKVIDREALGAAISKAMQFDRSALVEQFIAGREFTVALLHEPGAGSVRALPVVEICAPGGDYGYDNKYFGDETKYVCPAPIDQALTQQMQTLSRRAFEALGCEGWARVDILLDEATNTPVLLEINTSPGMTDHSLVPMAAREAGMTYDALVMHILGTARLKTEMPRSGLGAGDGADE
jgi:D-alanine-D-alanine ligase